MRPTDIEDLIGDASKAKKELGWKPKTNFKDLVKSMVEHDSEQVKSTIK
jgi:GDPmannose 4,6-dehydratase